jgi:hypothetical protein
MAMRMTILAAGLALAGAALLLPGCPGSCNGGGGGEPAAASRPAPASPTAAPKDAFDPNDKDQVLAIYAAHQAADRDLLRSTCQRYGLYDANGVPVMEQYGRYTAAVSRYATEHPDEWAKFRAENEGKWRAYLQARPR